MGQIRYYWDKKDGVYLHVEDLKNSILTAARDAPNEDYKKLLLSIVDALEAQRILSLASALNLDKI